MPEQLRELHLLLVDGDRLLATAHGALPMLRVPLADDDTTVLAALRGVRDAWGLDGPLLEIHFDYGAAHDDAGDGWVGVLVVLEPPSEEWPAPEGLGWRSLDDPDPSVHPGLRARLEELLAERRGRQPIASLRPPWSMPGWLDRATGWIDQVLADAGRSRTGPPEQIRHWGISALLRVPTADGRLWFKAVFPLFHHEPAVTELLDRTSPGTVPPVLGREDHEGWLLLDEVAGTSAAEVPASDASVIGSLIAVQHRFVDRADELEAAGAPARPFATVAGELSSALADPEVREWLDVTDARAEVLVRAVERTAEEVAELGIPDTLVHGDFHPDNALVGAGPPVIIDWSDAAIAHPLVDALTWVSWLREDPDRAQRAWEAFRDGWTGFATPDAIDGARRALTIVTAGYHAVSYAGIVRGMERLRRPELSDGLQHYIKVLDEAAGGA
jgi:hypothetical protein